jgi:hypothetical protein
LALVVNGALGLGFAPKNVGAAYSDFLTALSARAPEIHARFTDPQLLEFLGRVSALRHFAAHRGSIAPTKIYKELDPQPSRAELDAEIARQGLDSFLAVVPDGPIRDGYKAILRQNMLISMMEIIEEGVVPLEIKGKPHYIRPMSDIEWNFERFHTFLAAVLGDLIKAV